MNANRTQFWALYLSLPLAVLVVVAAWGGVFWPSVYARETPIWAAEGKGGDAVNLGVVVPVLLVSAVFTLRRSVSAQLIWMGTLFFLVYNSLIYCVAVHFNSLFLVYCSIFGLSFYALAGSVTSLRVSEIASHYGSRIPARIAGVVLLLMAFVFGAQWLREIIPALRSGHAPSSVIEAGLLTSPVHVLDLSLILPGFLIIGIALARRKPLGIVWAPILIVFAILMLIAIAGMNVAMRLTGLATNWIGAVVFIVGALALSVLVGFYFRARCEGFAGI